jgi:hypothetical protein
MSDTGAMPGDSHFIDCGVPGKQGVAERRRLLVAMGTAATVTPAASTHPALRFLRIDLPLQHGHVVTIEPGISSAKMSCCYVDGRFVLQRQRRELLQILTPHDPRVLAARPSERMVDAVGGEELVEALRARHREVALAAPDPQQIELLVDGRSSARNWSESRSMPAQSM